MDQSLETNDVRALLRLLGELRELGSDPGAWRTHLAQTLERVCRAQVSVVAELRVNAAAAARTVTNCAEVVTSLQAVDHGIDESVRERFYRELYFTDHETDDALTGILPLYGKRFTILRSDVVEAGHWERSFVANERFRPFGCDDFVLSMAPVSSLGVISSLEIYSGPGRGFTGRDRLFIELLHEELSTDWNRREPEAARLTPRQRQVLGRLAEGASEKEIAYDLGVSIHTAHDHVKAIHRAYGARSRGELLARLAAQRPPRTRLVADNA